MGDKIVVGIRETWDPRYNVHEVTLPKPSYEMDYVIADEDGEDMLELVRKEDRRCFASFRGGFYFYVIHEEVRADAEV